MGTIKSELDRSHYLMMKDLMDLIKNYGHENNLIKEDNYNLGSRFEAFKHEFA